MLTYDEAMAYMNKVNALGSVLGLDTMKELLKRLGNPENELKIIHIGGTNGKGSVSSYLFHILMEAGYKVGRYISPTLFEYRERIQVGNKGSIEYISEDSFAKILSDLIPIMDKMIEDGFSHPTPFELETAICYLYFKKTECEYVTLEVGLGGLEDATNTIERPICSVLTSISMDHMQFLGDTIEKIAYAKAGIIKKECKVVSYEQIEVVKDVLDKACKEKNTNLNMLNFTHIENIRYSLEETIFDFESRKDLKVHVLGEIQPKNAAVAIRVIDILKDDVIVTEEQLRNGLLKATWAGRFDLIHKKPIIISDGAHNLDAAMMLRKSMDIYFKDRKLILIVGVFADKDYVGVLERTADKADCIITIKPDNPRGLDSMELKKVASRFCTNVINGETLENGLSIAMNIASKDDVIIAFGSLSFQGQLYKYVLKN